jgi:hypothetical protein
VHLLVDSTGLRFCGPGEWLSEKHGTKTTLPSSNIELLDPGLRDLG